MNTDKIREALETALNARERDTAFDGLFREAIAELDAAHEVLTDEKCREIERAWQQAHGADITHAMAFSDGLATARDYLAPAAGLTVEEAMEAMRPFASELMQRQVRARLTAAMEAKTRKP